MVEAEERRQFQTSVRKPSGPSHVGITLVMLCLNTTELDAASHDSVDDLSRGYGRPGS